MGITLFIPVHKLVPEIANNPDKLQYLRNVGIDFATNTIQANFEGWDISIFYFEDYDMKLSNRWVIQQYSVGMAGILIDFTCTRDVSNRKTNKEQLRYE